MPDTAPFSTVPPIFADIPKSVSFKKLRKRLARNALQVIDQYGLVDRAAETRPKWLVCLSGGKDSYGLLSVLLDLQWQGALPVDLLACNLDQGQPGFPKHVLPDWLDKTGIDYRIETEDTYANVKDSNTKMYWLLPGGRYLSTSRSEYFNDAGQSSESAGMSWGLFQRAAVMACHGHTGADAFECLVGVFSANDCDPPSAYVCPVP